MKTSKRAPLLIRNKGFLALLVAQFLGALNDNLFKVVATLLAIGWIQDTGAANRAVSLAGALFALPFVVFSMHAGYVADRFSKRTIAVITKTVEICVVAAGVLSLWTKSLPAMMGVLFLMGLHSAYFGPAKYGLLPEILDEDDLSNGNGIIQMTTFLAIILGTTLGGALLGASRMAPVVGAVLLCVAVLGLVAALRIPRVPPAGSTAKPDWNPVRRFVLNLKEIGQDRALKLCLWGIGYFWLVGALFLVALPLYGKMLMGADDAMITRLMTVLSLGIGFGSVIAGKLSGDKVELGLVPLGSLGLGLFTLDLAFAYSSPVRVAVDLFMAGFSAGFFVIPLDALLQSRSPRERRGAYLATANLVSFIGIIGASCVYFLLTDRLFAGLDPAKALAVVGGCALLATLLVARLLGPAMTRFVFFLLTHSVYRIKAVGAEHLPRSGPALLVCNHVAYVDPFLVSSAVSRPIRFFMWRKIYDWKPLTWFFRMMGMIPISADDKPKQLMASIQEARQALKDGQVVCIFAEGAITRVGQTLGFRKGFEAVMKGVDAPIIPVHLDRVWGSVFSFHGRRFIWKRPRRLPYPVTVSFGRPLPSTAKADEARQAVLDLGSEAFEHRLLGMKPLPVEFIKRAKRYWFRRALVDSTGMELNFGAASAASVLMARWLRNVVPNGQCVGVLFPPSVAGALANIALTLAGKTPVNLNFTLSRDIMEHVIQKAGIDAIVTSRRVAEGLQWGEDQRFVFLEDMPTPRPSLKVCVWLLLRIMPVSLVLRLFLGKNQTKLADPATLMFTSGSTGVPKGVIVSHRNVLANVHAMLDVLQLRGDDVLVGVLPLFHSFGYTGTVWFPLLGGFRVAYHRSPLETAAVQKLINEQNATAVLTTPTFLQMWMKKLTREDLRGMRYVITGAEKLRAELAREFQDRYGFPVLEGYGCTELSPAACVSVFDVHDQTERQSGFRPGKVGRPLPGVSVRIVDPATREPLPSGRPGLILVKGPNVMGGYWKDPERTREVLQDGWYVTGDIATIDEDGFVQITDRLSRFSKIGGEMVPHFHVEEAVYRAAGNTEAKFLVVSAPDDKRGETLAVLCFQGGNLDALHARLRDSALPKLWVPDRRNLIEVNAWPTLATGKVDVVKAKQMAERHIFGERVD